MTLGHYPSPNSANSKCKVRPTIAQYIAIHGPINRNLLSSVRRDNFTKLFDVTERMTHCFGNWWLCRTFKLMDAVRNGILYDNLRRCDSNRRWFQWKLKLLYFYSIKVFTLLRRCGLETFRLHLRFTLVFSALTLFSNENTWFFWNSVLFCQFSYNKKTMHTRHWNSQIRQLQYPVFHPNYSMICRKSTRIS